MPEVTPELRRWRRRVIRAYAAALSPAALVGILGLLSHLGWVSLGEDVWQALSVGAFTLILIGAMPISRIFAERPDDADDPRPQ